MRPLLILSCALAATSLSAADAFNADPNAESPRIVGEVSVGTAGFEGGLAGEFRYRNGAEWQIRPEVFINDDSRIGVALSLSWNINAALNLPEGHDLFIGPRVAFHNSDHDKWGLDAMGIYSFPLFPDKPFHHHIEIIGTAGVLEYRDDNDNVSSRLGASIGVGYAYKF